VIGIAAALVEMAEQVVQETIVEVRIGLVSVQGQLVMVNVVALVTE